MTPKSLLRHKRVISRLDEMGPGKTFHRVLWDDAQSREGEAIKLVADNKIRRVVMCSGKIYYDLYEAREAAGIDDVYLMRVEQLYPFPARALIAGALPLPEGRDGVGAGGAEATWAPGRSSSPSLEWVLDQVKAKHARARYAGRAVVGGDGDGPREEARAGAEDALVEQALGA